MVAMTFDDRLRQAIERGQKRSELLAREAAAKAWTEEEYRRSHSHVRLTLSDHIESCLKRLPNYFPGFQYETMYGDRGWGGACFRDDLVISRGNRTTKQAPPPPDMCGTTGMPAAAAIRATCVARIKPPP